MLTSVRKAGKTNRPPRDKSTAAAGMTHTTDMTARDVLISAPTPTETARNVAMIGPAEALYTVVTMLETACCKHELKA